jgi:hypothetical protein
MSSGNVYRAELRAAQVLKALRIASLPVDPFQIAASHSIEHQEDPNLDSGISGCLMKVGDAFGILYSTRFASEGFRRFTVAHELGHYFLEGHAQRLFGKGQILHQSESGFNSDDEYEREADSFAAGLLMPRQLFEPACDHAGLGLEAIEVLADLCKVSLTAAGIRYAQCAADSVAVICSMDGRIQFAFMSRALKDRRELTWLRKGASLPRGTATRNFGENPRNVSSGKRVTSTSTLDVWFDGGGDAKLNEEVVGLGGYGRILTVLSSDSLPDPDEAEEGEERESENLLPSQRWRERD